MSDNSRSMVAIIGVVVVALLGVMVGTYIVDKQNDTATDRISNAAEDLADGVEDATEEMRDRSAGEKVGDAIEDTGDAIKDAAR